MPTARAAKMQLAFPDPGPYSSGAGAISIVADTANGDTAEKAVSAPGRSPSRLRLAAVFGSDDRTRVPARYRHLEERIGLFVNRLVGTQCTAFCVAPGVIATASHCLFRRTAFGPQPLAGFRFEVGRPPHVRQSRISGLRERAALQNILAGTVNLRVRPPIDAANDWALVRLEKPICRGRVLPVRGLSPMALEQAASENRVFQISYHRDYRRWQLAFSTPCRVRREFHALSLRQVSREFRDSENLLLHKCDTGGASSGSPLLIEAPGGPYVVGINVGTYVQSRTPLDQSRTGRLAASMQTIANTAVNARAFEAYVPLMAKARLLVRRERLRQLQARLRELNFYGGPIDGLYGHMTRVAIQAYERSRKRPPLGLPTVELLRELGDAPPLPVQNPVRAHQVQASMETMSFIVKSRDRSGSSPQR